MPAVEVIERPLDQYRNLKGKAKTSFWRKNKSAIVAQGQDEDRKQQQKRGK